MAKCKNVDIFSRVKVCAGDLRHYIILHSRDLTAPENVDFGVELTTSTTVKAALTVQSGVGRVDDTNQLNKITHVWHVRWQNNLDRSYMVEFDNRFFTVDTIEELDGYKRFVRINTYERGDKSTAVNFV